MFEHVSFEWKKMCAGGRWLDNLYQNGKDPGQFDGATRLVTSAPPNRVCATLSLFISNGDAWESADMG